MTLDNPFDGFVWRLVFAQVVTLRECDTHWDLYDILTAIEILEARELAEKRAHEKAMKK